jgi:hypothetical protein
MGRSSNAGSPHRPLGVLAATRDNPQHGELLPACPRPVTPVMMMTRLKAELQLELRDR